MGLGAGAALFAVNNLLLARLLTSLPGGTILAATDMAAIALVVLAIRRFGGVVLVYGAYGALGVLGHLGVDAGTYVLHLPRVLGAALVFDAVIALGGFRRRALALGLLPFAFVLQFDAGMAPRQWLLMLLLAYAGLAAGVLVHAAWSRRSGARTPDGESPGA